MGDLRDLDFPAIQDGVIKFVTSLAQESERAAVILGAARLDWGLEQLLIASMQPYPGGEDNLFDPERPLSTFSAKISAAHRLGLIDNEVERALQLIRKIRNSFAHSIESDKLSNSSHRNRLTEVTRSCDNSEVFRNLKKSFTENVKLQAELAIFCAAVAVLIIALEMAKHCARPPQVSVIATFDYRRQIDDAAHLTRRTNAADGDQAKR